MKGKINPKGLLEINRSEGRYFPQSCPYQKDRLCGDACPLFGTPTPIREYVGLELCQAILYFEELTDERAYEEEKSHLTYDGEDNSD